MPVQRRVAPLLVRISALLVFTASLLPPLAFYLLSLNHTKGNLEAEAETTARMLTAVVTRNPDLWEFQEARIEAILQVRPSNSPLESRRVYNEGGEIVAESLDILKTPVASASHEIMDSGVEVGRVEISRTLRPVARLTAALLAISLSLALIFFILLRIIINGRLGEAEEQLFFYQRKLQESMGALAVAEETERRELATLLHDDISQILVLCRSKLEEPPKPGGTGSLVKDAAGARELLAEAVARSRDLTESLSSQALQELGLPAALDELCHTIGDTHGLYINLKKQGNLSGLPERTKGIFFRSARELLTNVVKHAGAQSVAVTLLEKNGQLRLTVTDDGTGLSANGQRSGRPASGFGLFSIRENMRYLGGEMDIRSHGGGGTRIILQAPTGGKRETRDSTQDNPVGSAG